MHSSPTISDARPRGVSVSFVLLAALLTLMAIAGGASRFDVSGQMIVRAGVILELMVWVILVPRPIQVARVPLTIIALAILVVAVQLIPLPPAVWSALPGGDLRDAAGLGGMPPPWRPLAIVPPATINALFSLMVPFAVVVFAGACRPEEQRRVLTALVIVIGATTFAELVQFAGNDLVSPFINGRPGQPSGLFANRNHQALLLAIGCVAVPVWATLPGRTPAWRSWTALGCVTLLALMIVATGSRAGLFMGLLAILAIPVTLRLTSRDLRGADGRHRRLLLVVIVAAGLTLTILALWAGRSESLDRLREIDTATDMRTRGLPVVLALIREYWVFGAGFGSFDPLFRVDEPFALLKSTYFNQAHNDILEIVILGGLPAVALFMGSLLWVATRTLRIWREGTPLARLGAVTILLVVVASLFDYPARTPTIMMVVAIAAVWLSANPQQRRSSSSTLTRS